MYPCSNHMKQSVKTFINICLKLSPQHITHIEVHTMHTYSILEILSNSQCLESNKLAIEIMTSES